MKIVYGTAKCGKTTFCLNQIKKSESNVILIVPDQATAEFEKKLTLNNVYNAEVLSFNRLCHKVFNYTGTKLEVLSSVSQNMILSKITAKLKLEYFRNLHRSPGTIELIQKLFSEVKQELLYDIEPAGSSDPTGLKLQDLKLIFDEYQKFLKNRYIDPSDNLTLLKDELKLCPFMRGAVIWFDGFIDFTKQQYSLIEEMKSLNCDLNFSFCIDNINNPLDIFEFTKRAVEKLPQAGFEYIKLEENYIKHRDLMFMEKNLFRYSKLKCETENISLYLAGNPCLEIDYVTNKIINLVREHNIRFRDIAVIAGDTNVYEKFIRIKFRSSNIPYFIDKSAEYNNLNLFLLNIFDIFTDGYKHIDVFKYLKSGFIKIRNQGELDRFENYVLENGINSKWQKDFKEFEEVKNFYLTPLFSLHENIKRKSVDRICMELYKFFQDIKLEDTLSFMIDSFKTKGELVKASACLRSYNNVIRLLDELSEFLAGERISIRDFYNLFKVGLETVGANLIPPTSDQVVISSLKESKPQQSKILFVIGINDGLFPVNTVRSELLDEQGRIALKLPTPDINLKNQLKIYNALTSATDRIFLSYSSSDIKGKALRASIILTRIRNLFSNLQENTSQEDIEKISSKNNVISELTLKIRELYEGGKISYVWKDAFHWYKKNYNQKITNILSALNYSNNPVVAPVKSDRFSISQFERYANCPFSYFAAYVLKLRMRKDGKLMSLNTGSFVHDVICEYCRHPSNMGFHSKNEDCHDHKIIDDIIERLVKEKYKIFTYSKGHEYTLKRLKNMILKMTDVLRYQINQGEFKPVYYEHGFNEEVNIGNGITLNLNGKVDRVDICDKTGHISIIDYKTGKKDLELEDVYNGINIQLPVYMKILKDTIDGAKPAGMFYFLIDNPFITAKPNILPEELRAELYKKLRLKGKIINFEETGCLFDRNMGKTSTVIDFNPKKTLLENFGDMEEFLDKLLIHFSTSIREGKFDIEPYKNDRLACERCDFKTICRFDEKKNIIRKPAKSLV